MFEKIWLDAAAAAACLSLAGSHRRVVGTESRRMSAHDHPAGAAAGARIDIDRDYFCSWHGD